MVSRRIQQLVSTYELHETRGGGVLVVQTNSTQNTKICPNLHFQGRGPTQPKVPRSVKICIFRGGCWGGECGGLDQLNLKCQDLSKSAFSGGGREVVVQTNSTQSAKICRNLHWGGVGGGPDQLNPKCQDLPKSAFFRGRGGGGPDQLNPKCQDLSKSAFSGGGGKLW